MQQDWWTGLLHSRISILIISVPDPWHFGVDPDPRIHASDYWIRIRILDPDPAIVIDLQDATKKLIFNTNFSAYFFLKVHLHNFSKIKSQKESQNSRNQCYSYYFCMMIEGSGSGSIPLTSRSGSGRPKNMWIRWIRIRIRNTVNNINFKHTSWWIYFPPYSTINYYYGSRDSTVHTKRSNGLWVLKKTSVKKTM